MRRSITLFVLAVLFSSTSFAQQSQTGSVTVNTPSGDLTANVTTVGPNTYVSVYKTDGGDGRLRMYEINHPVYGKLTLYPPSPDTGSYSLSFEEKLYPPLILRVQPWAQSTEDIIKSIGGIKLPNGTTVNGEQKYCAPETPEHECRGFFGGSGKVFFNGPPPPDILALLQQYYGFLFPKDKKAKKKQ